MMELQAVGSLLRVERRRAIHSKKKSVSEMGNSFCIYSGMSHKEIVNQSILFPLKWKNIKDLRKHHKDHKKHLKGLSRRLKDNKKNH
jgi:hypothetical protein